MYSFDVRVTTENLDPSETRRCRLNSTTNSQFSILSAFVFACRIVLAFTLMLGAGDVFAHAELNDDSDTRYFVNSSKQFESFNGNTTCDGCHTPSKKPSLTLSAPEVASGATSATLTLNGKASNASQYYWRFRVGSSGDGQYVERLPTSTVTFSANSQNPEVEYCIAEKAGTTRDSPRNWNCDAFEIQRANDAPVISSIANRSLNEGEVSTVSVSVDDESPGTVNIELSSNSNSDAVEVEKTSNNQFRLTAKRPGSSNITIRATDDKGASDTETFSVTVIADTPPDEPPVISDISDQSLTEDQNRTITVVVSDEEPESVSLAVTDNSDSSVVSVTVQGSDTLQLSAEAEGTSVITVRATDNKGQVSEAKTFEVRVTAVNVNQPPSIDTIATQSLELDESRVVNINVNDEDTSSVTLAVTGNSNPAVVSAEIDSGKNLKLTANAESSSQVTITATDSAGETGTATFTVNVAKSEGENNPPVISGLSDLSLKVADNQSVNITVEDEEPESVGLSILSNSAPLSVFASLDGNTLKIQALLPGSSTIVIRATDREGLSSTASLNVDVVTAGVPPVIIGIDPGDELVLEIGGQIIVELDLDDDDDERFEFSASSSNNAVVTIIHQDDGKYQVTAIGEGTATLSLTVSNSFNLQAQVTIDVTVNNANESPVANDDQFVFLFQGDSQELDVLVNDTDKENSDLTIILESAQSDLGGSISVGDAVVSYMPPSPFTQQDSFTYKVMDAAGNTSNSASVSIIPSDTDGDGAFDGNDNCPILANTAQRDDDSDMIGNLCDVDPDGDGEIGESGNPFTTGKSLVESVCLECHREGLQGAPAFGDNDAWKLRVDEAGGIPPLLNSVSLGKGAMPALGSEYTARELTQAILYLTGLEDPGLSGNFIDRDLDGINDFNDNCINHPNGDQLDSNSNGIGNDCEPDSNNDGVLDYSLSFQFFQETPTGRVTGGIVKAGAGQVTVLARTRAEIPGLTYNWSNSDAAILELFDGEPTSDVVTFTPTSSDTGVYNLDVTVQGSGIQGKTRARLVVVGSTLTADLSDQDYDGIPASLDNDNANANRILSDSNSAAGSSVFYSDQSITLGAFTAQQAASSGYSRAKATLTQAEFLAAAQLRFPEITPVADSTIDNSIGVINFELRDLDTVSASVRLNLLGNVPLNAILRVYNPSQGTWRDFSGTGIDSIASAPLVSGECPASGSPNYTNGLIVGQSCVRFSLSDGGPNDADGVRDGVIAMTGVIGSLLSDPADSGGPGTVDLNPTKSGGGSLSWLLVAFMTIFALRRTRRLAK